FGGGPPQDSGRKLAQSIPRSGARKRSDADRSLKHSKIDGLVSYNSCIPKCQVFSEGVCMQRTLGLAFVIVAFSSSAWPQAKPATTAPPHRAAAKPAPVDENAPDPIAIIDTTVGKMTCTLYPKKAPVGVANFIGLSTGTKDWTNPTTHKKMHGVALYDGTIFHRVIPNFMIQGGDAQGNCHGEPGYNFQNETSPDLTFDRPGRLAYANRGPDTNGSQFFITEVPYPSLNGGYTIFGQCDDASIALVKQI